MVLLDKSVTQSGTEVMNSLYQRWQEEKNAPRRHSLREVITNPLIALFFDDVRWSGEFKD